VFGMRGKEKEGEEGGGKIIQEEIFYVLKNELSTIP
jgi:hypothetical protein